MTLAAEVINENIWDAVNGLVLINEVNGVKQMISVDTINGKKVRSFVETKRSEKVKEVFQNGLPSGMNVVFVSVVNENK